MKSELSLFSLKVGVIIAFSIVWYGIFLLKDFLIPLLIALIFVFLSAPLLDFMEKKGVHRVLSITILLSMVTTAGFLLFVMVTPILVRELVVFEGQIRNMLLHFQNQPEALEWIFQSYSNRYLLPLGVEVNMADIIPMLRENISGKLTQGLGVVKQSAVSLLSGIFNVIQAVTSLVLVVILYVFAAIERETLSKFFLSLFPKKEKTKIQNNAKGIDRILLLWWKGQIIQAGCMALITVVATFLLRLFGVPLENIISLALIAWFCVFIPVFWPILAMIPALLMALHGGFFDAAAVVLVYIGIQQIEGYVLIPKIHGDNLQFSSFQLIVCMLVSGVLFWILGILLTLPILASMRVLFSGVFHRT